MVGERRCGDVGGNREIDAAPARAPRGARAATTETTVETVETPRRTPRDAVLESGDEEAAIPLLSEDEGEDDAHGEDGDDEEEGIVFL